MPKTLHFKQHRGAPWTCSVVPLCDINISRFSSLLKFHVTQHMYSSNGKNTLSLESNTNINPLMSTCK